MVKDQYQYVLDFYKEDGSSLGQLPVCMDWEPALQWTQFEGIRQGKLPPVMTIGPSSVEPIWDSKAGQPYLQAIRVIVETDQGHEVTGDIPLTYFGTIAQHVSYHFLKTGVLKAGDFYRYLVSAFPRSLEREEVKREKPEKTFSVKPVSRLLPLQEASLAELETHSSFSGMYHEGDIPVFIPRAVLAESVHLSRQAGALETGGILVGHLNHDSGRQEIFINVTAQIPARYAKSELEKLTFTADTWTAVTAAIELRRQGEWMVGWWHSHSYQKKTCQNCEKGKKGMCKETSAFFSVDDCGLHRCVFSGAFNIGLLIAESPCAGLNISLYGWRKGMIVSRGFHILNTSEHSVQDDTAVVGHFTGGYEHDA